MSRIRSIKPEFFSDEKLARVSRESRLLFIGLWTVACDDYGVSRAHPGFLKQIFPYDNDLGLAEIDRLVDELEAEGFVSRFEAQGERYLVVWNWSKHQKVDHPGKCRNPLPPENLARVSRESRDILAQDLGPRTIGPRTVGPSRRGDAQSASLASPSAPEVDEEPTPPQQLQPPLMLLLPAPTPKRPRREKANGAAVGSPQALLVEAWGAVYARCEGVPYRHSAADFIRAADLARQGVTPEEVSRVAGKAFRPGIRAWLAVRSFKALAERWPEVATARVVDTAHNAATREELEEQIAKYGNEGEL